MFISQKYSPYYLLKTQHRNKRIKPAPVTTFRQVKERGGGEEEDVDSQVHRRDFMLSTDVPYNMYSHFERCDKRGCSAKTIHSPLPPPPPLCLVAKALLLGHTRHVEGQDGHTCGCCSPPHKISRRSATSNVSQ